MLEQLKADLLREQAGVDFSEIKLSEDREREERSSGYDGGNRDDYNRDRDGSSGAGVSDQNLQSTSTDTRTGSPAVKGQEPRGRKERKSGAVRCIASSTSYRSVGQYDREYIYDEDSKDFFTEDTNRREDVDVTQSGSSRQGSSRKIVTIPCDLTDQGSAIHVMSELKKLGIDDKVI